MTVIDGRVDVAVDAANPTLRPRRRPTRESAGCVVCHGRGVVGWTGVGSVDEADEHNRATGHATWAERVELMNWGAR